MITILLNRMRSGLMIIAQHKVVILAIPTPAVDDRILFVKYCGWGIHVEGEDDLIMYSGDMPALFRI